MEIVTSWFGPVKNVLDFELFKSGTTVFTLWTILYLLIFLFLLFYLSGKLKQWLVEKALAKMRLGARQALASIIRYAVIVIGVLIILQTAGINLTTFQVLAGAVGIGVGFGLQNIVSNFVSGLIILFERPIQIGDRIDVGNIEGDVIAINARSTTVVTNDNIAIIIPNTKFITENVVNWSLTGKDVRFRIPVSIAYGSDLNKVVNLLEEIARENPDVLDTPPPAVRLLGFGENQTALLLELRVWSTTLTHRKATLVSTLNFAIYEKFQAHGIEMSTPQFDISLKTGIPGGSRPEAPGQVESGP